MTGPYQRRRTAPIGSNAASSLPVTAPSEEVSETVNARLFYTSPPLPFICYQLVL